MKVYITGVSGVGKSSVAEELQRRGIKAIDMDAMEGLCFWENKETRKRADYYTGIGRDWLEAHSYMCAVSELKEIINRERGDVVVLGLISNQEEYLHLFDKIILLHCNEETFLHRIRTRSGDNQFAKDPSEQEHILSWYREYEEDMRKKGAIPIDTDRPVDEVAEEIQKVLNH